MSTQPQFNSEYFSQNHSQVNSKYIDNISTSSCPSYDAFKNKKDCCVCCDPNNCDEHILCSQAWMSNCEAHLFCEATNRLSYELCRARTLNDVKQVIELINCLFSSSAIKENALAEVLKSYSMLKCPKYYDCNYCCDERTPLR